MNKSLIICLEGNIGVGKTTLMEKLKQYQFMDGIFIDENVDEWKQIYNMQDDNILNRFYKNKQRWSFTFQNFVYLQRYMHILDVIQSNKPSYIFVDRSPDTDRYIFANILHKEGLINDIEWDIYNKWANMIDIYFNNYRKKYVYLRCEPEIALQRIKKRGRKEEENISIEYLTKLHRYHDSWIDAIPSKDKLVLDYNYGLDYETLCNYCDGISLLIDDI